MFKALLLDQVDNVTRVSIEDIDDIQLASGNVVVDIDYSSLNYKDGLAITGKGKIIRNFPMVPGIDFSGRVAESSDSRFKTGDSVVLTGWGVGETHWGGMAEKACVNADWLVPLPDNLDAKKTMMIGTAGLTAMLCVDVLIEAGVAPEQGEILVTGASGGVGSVAVTLLAQLGYQVVVLSGRSEENRALLTRLGASRIIDRSAFEEPAKPLEKQCWAGAVDTVGSHVLAKLLAQMQYGGAVSACGLAGGFDLPTTVMPFILRGVKLLGVDSVMCPIQKRQKAWTRLSELLPDSFYQQACREIELKDVPAYAEAITQGKVTGRVVIKL
ncbi:MDR family oxidoreductase [Kistimonas scapharcae]|uniref:MDR family oxidoreductase n=1 Tax=Kistimonas scapharcae TaxID=1036133 RepID=A0ABP8V1I5_9GAMM